MLINSKEHSCLDKNSVSKGRYFLCYTLLFIFTALLVNFVFIRNGLTYVRSVDGYVQHVVALEYYGQWLRDFFAVLFTEHRLEIQNFDFSIGMGSDVVTTFNYYSIGDPLNLLSVFVPKEYTAYLYTALTIFRQYLAGLAFSLYCFTRKHKNHYGILAASVLYAFSVFAVVAGPMHPFFINGMIYLPLIFLSVEKILEGKNPLYLAAIVCVAEVSNFYFFYMLVFATVVYVLIRLFSIYGISVKRMLAPLFRIAVSSVIGVLMGGLLFLPTVMAFLSDGRVGVEHTYPLLYDYRYYIDLFVSMIYYNGYEPWTLVGTGVLVLYALAALFASRKKNAGLKTALVICGIGICLPAFGGFSNGFSYASNRWCFILTFAMCLACSLLWEDILFQKNRLKGLAVAFLPGLYAGICVYLPYAQRDKLKLSLVFVALSSLAVVVGMLVSENKVAKRAIQTAVILINVGFIAVNSYYNYSSTAKYFYTQQDVNSAVSQEYTAVSAQEDEDFFRYSSNRLEFNNATKNGGFATQYYWSLSDRNISDFQDSVYLNEGFYQHYNGFDDIAVFNSLSSVKYYYYKAEDEGAVPYGFVKTDTENLYMNPYALPLIYAYDSYTTKQEYDSLTSSPEKQQLMLGSAVLEQEAELVSRGQPKINVTELQYEVAPDSEYVTVQDGKFTVTKNGATVTFKIKNVTEGEAYLSLRDIKCRVTTPMELYGDNSEVDPLGLFDEEALKKSGVTSLAELSKKKWVDPEYLNFITLASDDEGKSEKRNLKFYTPTYKFYAGKKDCDLYLGYSEDGFTEVVLSFPLAGIYSFGELSLLVQDMDFYADGIEKLTYGIQSDYQLHNDKITAEVSLDKNSLVCFSVPYSEGWSVYVDGKEMELLKANVMHMAVEIEEGEHDIELRYSSPYRKAGAVVSLAGFILLFAYGLWYYIKKNKKCS